jgi:hypothetical protein
VKRKRKDPVIRRMRHKPSDFFVKKLIITIPRSGALLLGLWIALGLGIHSYLYGTFLSIMSLVMTSLALGVIIEARWRMRNFRYEITKEITEAFSSCTTPDVDLRETEAEIEDAENIVVRLSKRSTAS